MKVEISGQYYDYYDMKKYIETKYDVSLRDFENKWFGVESKDHPNYDLWDYLWDYLCDRLDIFNGTLRTVNWQELKDEVEEDWQKTVLGYFVSEFGDTDYDILFCW